jgi:hypothetical protein
MGTRNKVMGDAELIKTNEEQSYSEATIDKVKKSEIQKL